MELERYYKINGNGNVNALKIEVYYNLGGYNVWTYRSEPRGYYLLVLPVKRDGIMESFEAFTGTRYCISQVSRQSNKRFEEAKAQLPKLMETIVKTWCEKNSLDVDFNDYTERIR